MSDTTSDVQFRISSDPLLRVAGIVKDGTLADGIDEELYGGGQRMTETLIERLKAMKHPEWNTDVARAWPHLLAAVDAAKNLLHFAELRGDNHLPNPTDDPKPWAADTQMSWVDVESALAELEKEAR